MTGKLYGVGVGPGDPELITLKALRLTKEADILAFPGENPKESVASPPGRGRRSGKKKWSRFHFS